MKKTIRVLMLGDLVGSTGRAMLQKHLARIKQEYKIDAAIVNGENTNANGRGITARIAKSLKHNGIDVVTTGNHIWDQRDIYEYLKNNQDVIRPANFSSDCPGIGYTTFNCQGIEVAVVNMQGQVFMREHVDCPFKTMDSILTYLKHKTNVILVDFHAETTAEKLAFGYYLDGKVSCVVGTHTHVPTADERVLPKGTAYVTDLGMGGSLHSLIGFKKDAIIEKFKNQMPTRFMVETEPPVVMTGIWVEIDTQTGKALQIQRLKVIDEDLCLDGDS
tara:strand:+ start:7164 stop:7988 length:825 start_codon:yes stop_codon:yes gene_type:complete